MESRKQGLGCGFAATGSAGLTNLFALIFDPSSWAALATLIAMEIVLGVDNLIFVAILSNKIAAPRRAQIRRLGLVLALAFRLALLASIASLVQLTAPLLTLYRHDFSIRDLVLLGGGLFLVWKATREIHESVEPERAAPEKPGDTLGVAAALGQIIVLDLVFSIDSIVTAVGMTDHVPIMFVAVVVAVGVMIVASDILAAFIARNPTIVMLALSFLVMIGMSLIAEGFGANVPKAYIYFAMLFSTSVEALNILARRRRAHYAPRERE